MAMNMRSCNQSSRSNIWTMQIYHTAQYFEDLLFVHSVLYLNVNHVKYIFLFTIKMIGKLLYTYHASDILKFNENMQKI